MLNMHTFLFSVAPAAVGQLHDILTCLAKFEENVSWQATHQNVGVMLLHVTLLTIKLRLSSLNLSKTAHACFVLDTSFFVKYHCSPDTRSTTTAGVRVWSCKVQNRVSF